MKRLSDTLILIGIFVLFSSLLSYDWAKRKSQEPLSQEYSKVSKPSDAIEIEATCLENQYKKKMHEAELLIITQ